MVILRRSVSAGGGGGGQLFPAPSPSLPFSVVAKQAGYKEPITKSLLGGKEGGKKPQTQRVTHAAVFY